MDSSNNARVATRFGAFAAITSALWLFMLSGWLGVLPGRPASLRYDVVFQSDAGQRIDDTLTGENSFGIGSHFLIGKTWPRVLGFLNRQWSDPATAAVYHARLAAAMGAGVGLGILFGCLVRIGWSRGRCIATLAFLLASSYQVVACLPDHFAFSSGLLPACFGIYLLAINDALSKRGAIYMLIGLSILAASICLTNALWPALQAVALKLEVRQISWRVAVPMAIISLVGFAIMLMVIERHGYRWPITWQAKQWLHLRLVNDPAGALLRASRGMLDPVIAPSPSIDINNLNALPMLTFEPSLGMPIWPFDGVRSVAAIVWLVVLVQALRAIHKPIIRVLAIWIVWNLIFHNLWGDEFFLYSPHYGWALAIIPFMSERIGPILCLALVIVFAGQFLSLSDIADCVGRIDY